MPKEYWLRGKLIEDLTQEEIESLTWDEISSLFIDEETACPECGYEYTEEDIMRWRAVELAQVPWACPKCGQHEQPQVRHIHHMQELVNAWVDLVENLEWLAGVKPEMRTELEAKVAQARVGLEEQLDPTMLRWLDIALQAVPREPSDG